MASEKKMVLLRSSDGKAFEVSEEVIRAASGMIKGMIDEWRAAAAAVALPNVTAATLSRVLEYVSKHFGRPGAIAQESSFYGPNDDDDPLARFDDDFVNVDKDTLIDLIEAAVDLDIGRLLDLTCKAVADLMKGKTVDEIRKKFRIVNDYS